jgi:hypothetical protein
VHSLRLIFLLGLKDELLQDRVVTGNDAKGRGSKIFFEREKIENAPDGQNLAVAAIGLPRTPNPEPVASVVDGVGGIERGLENDTCLDLSWRQFVVNFLVVIAKRVVCCACEPRRRRACSRLKLPRALPLWATREPQHKPVIWIVLLGKVGREEECCGKKRRGESLQ